MWPPDGLGRRGYRRWSRSWFSLHLRAGFLDNLAPLDDLLLEEGRELGRRPAEHRGAFGGDLLAHLRHLQNPDEVGVEARDDRLGRAGLHEETEPGARLEAGIAGLRDGRHVGQVRDTLRCGDGESTE